MGNLSREELERLIREKRDELQKLEEQYQRQTDKQGFWSRIWSWIESLAPKIKKILEMAKDIREGIAVLRDILGR